MIQKIARFFALLLLVFTGAAGILNFLNQIDERQTLLQMTVTAGVLSYGVLGLVAGAAVFMRRAWSVWVLIGWAVAITYVATVAPRAYGGPEVPILAVVAGGIATAVVAGVVLWAARVSMRTHPA